MMSFGTLLAARRVAHILGGAMKSRSSVSAIAGLAGLIMLTTAVPAFADGTDPESGVVAPAEVADGAAVEPGSVTDAPAADAVSGEDGTGELSEDAALPGQADVVEEPVFNGKPSGGDLYPDAVRCENAQIVKITSNLANTMAVKDSTFVKNDRSSSIDFKFTSKKSGTTTFGGSITFSGEGKILWLGKIKTEVNANASKSWTSELGVEVGGKVKAHSTVYGDYGIMKENVYGYSYKTYSNCTVSDKTYAKVWAPYREGWVIK
ncbi:hypothetical protein FNH09_08350 [Streptomyces adustus]|uniref:Uncharacterized protein n=1 Tax=Streptomyces adustus TaxID=1609272 RepID=A0A5N8V7S4_9ACTN|nr:hypothetical protein [Streptomyces adustus]MPY31310.1 hypothetical protein [Streptomyces adustus]